MEENVKKAKIITLIITGTIFLGFLIYLIYHYFLFGKFLFNGIGQDLIIFFVFLPFFFSLIDYIIYKFRIFK